MSGRVRGHTFTSGVTTASSSAQRTTSYQTQQQRVDAAVAKSHNSARQHQQNQQAPRQPSPSSSRLYAKQTLALLSPADQAAAEAAQARIAALEEELAVHQRTVGELSKHIFDKNHEYIRTEEALCDRVGQFNKESAQREKAEPTPAEQRVFAERFRRASQLQEDVLQVEQRLMVSEKERTLAETSARRLEHHVKLIEDAVTTYADELESLSQLLTSLVHGPVVSDEGDDTNVQALLPTMATGSRNPAEIDESLAVLQDAVLERIPSTFRQRCPLQCASRVLMGRVDWLSHQLVRSFEDEGQMFQKKDAAIEAAKVHVEQRLAQHATILQEAQAALLEVHHSVLEKRHHLSQLQTKRAHLEGELAAAAKRTPPSTKQIAATEAAIIELESELTTLSLESARESERVALQRTETSLATARAQQSQEAIDEATEILAGQKSSLKSLEQETSELSRRHFQLEEQNAQAEMQVSRLTAELAAVQEELRAAEAQFASSGDEDMEISRQWRQIERELDGLRAARESARQRLELKSADREALERNLSLSREERAHLRRDILATQAKRTELSRREQETIRELQYVQQLLPKNHPSAKLSRKLQERIMWDPLEAAEMEAMAASRKDELIASAKKSQRQREDAKRDGIAESAAVPPPTHGGQRIIETPPIVSLSYDDVDDTPRVADPHRRHLGQSHPHYPRSPAAAATGLLPQQQPTSVQLSSTLVSRTPTPTPFATPSYDSLLLPPESRASSLVAAVPHSAAKPEPPTWLADSNHTAAYSHSRQPHPLDAMMSATERLPSSSVRTDTTVTSAPPSDTYAAYRPTTTSSYYTDTYGLGDHLGGGGPPRVATFPSSSLLFPRDTPTGLPQPPPSAPRSISATSTSTHASSIAEINEKLNEIMNRRRRP